MKILKNVFYCSLRVRKMYSIAVCVVKKRILLQFDCVFDIIIT